MNIKDEKGVAMVEATIYMPLVLCTVMAMIYLALFNLQEYMLLYQAQKISTVAAREIAYIGYSGFNMGENNDIDFSWGGSGKPSDDMITQYYKDHYTHAEELYREVPNLFGGQNGVNESALASKFNNLVQSTSLLKVTAVGKPDIQVKNCFLGSSITVDIKHNMPIPGVMKYLDYEGGHTLKASSYTFAVNPSEFVRNVDLAAEFCQIIADKLGIQLDNFKEKTGAVLDKIL